MRARANGAVRRAAAKDRATVEAPPEQVAEGFVQSRSATWPTRSSRSRCSAATTSPNTRLCCFGGAAGQHACLVADALGMTRIFIHPLAGRAVGLRHGARRLTVDAQQAVESALELGRLRPRGRSPERSPSRRATELAAQGVPADADRASSALHLSYEGTDTALIVALRPDRRHGARVRGRVPQALRFLMPDRPLVAEAVSVEAIARRRAPSKKRRPASP